MVAAAVLVPGLLFAAAAWVSRNDVLRETRVETQHMARVMEEHAKKVLDTVSLVIARVEDHIAKLSDEEIGSGATSTFLASVRRPLEEAASIWISNSDGVVLAGSQPPQARTVRDRDFFQVHVKQDIGTFISAPFVGRSTQVASFALSRRRMAAEGRFTGIVHVALRQSYFTEFYGEAFPRSGHAAALARADGIILSRHPALPPAVSPETRFEKIGEVLQGEFTGASPVDARERFYAFRKIGGYPALVIFGADVPAALARWYRVLAFYGAVSATAALALLVVSLASFRHARAERIALCKLSAQTAQRIAAEDQLRHAHKMESIGQLTGGVAHDFNNLLAVVLGNLNLLKKRLTLTTQEAKLFDGAIRGAERGAAMTRRLLAYARRQDLAPQPVNVTEMADGLTELLRPTVGHDIKVKMDLPASLPPVKVDPNQLEVAILNLAINARDAMKRCGTVRVNVLELSL